MFALDTDVCNQVEDMFEPLSCSVITDEESTANKGEVKGDLVKGPSTLIGAELWLIGTTMR